MQLVQTWFRSDTLNKIEKLTKFFGTTNKCDVVVCSVKIAHMVAIEVLNGGRIELHRSNGDVKELVIQDARSIRNKI